jgi:hypothetical protein
MLIAGAVALMLFLGCGLYGWGGLARRAMGLPAGTWPMTVAIGLAAWIAIGGVLNVLRIAYPVAICVLLAIGCIFAVRSLWSGRVQAQTIDLKTRKDGAAWFYPAVWLGLASVIIGFAAVTQAAPGAFSPHDDYQKYFVHVVRLVQTGTLFGSPLNTLGSETLGGQAFLQCLFVGFLPIATINTADAVFCFGLTVLLAGGLALKRPALAPVALLAMLVIGLIEPQYVSVTALYSAAALMFATVTLSADEREFAAAGGDFPSSAAIGLFYAALVALKSTSALFVALHFLFCTTADVLAAALATGRVGAPLRRAMATCGWGVVFIAPWIALYGPLYWSAWTTPIAPLPIAAPVPATEAINLLATDMLFPGGSYAQYTFACAACLICGAMVLARRRLSDPPVARFVAICVAAPAAYLIMLLVMAPLLAGHLTALRHVLPVLIGMVPALVILCGSFAISSDGKLRRNLIPANIIPLMSGALAAVLVVWSAPDFWSRYQLLARTGSMLAFLRGWEAEPTDRLIAMSRDILQDPSTARHVAELQKQVPAGEALLAWIETPFWLDFNRNRIIDADIGGLANPWSRTPPVSYVLWQYGGPGIRQPSHYAAQMQGPGRRETLLAARGIYYASRLQNLLPRSQVLANDGNMVLLRIGPDAGLP